MAISENRRAHEARIYADGLTDRAQPYLHFFIERYREAFNAEIDDFVDAIENGRQPSVVFEDGRLALVLAEAAIKSVAERRVVSISEIGAGNV
jgi:myo-inositol 2-dehydrogenase/D-chiro-inositol 1-dehydrogenase